MEIEILERKENPLLKREEISFKIHHPDAQTPSRTVVISKLAAILNADTSKTILKEIQGQFGIQESLGHANVYEDENVALRLEPEHILIRNGLKEKEKK